MCSLIIFVATSILYHVASSASSYEPHGPGYIESANFPSQPDPSWVNRGYKPDLASGGDRFDYYDAFGLSPGGHGYGNDDVPRYFPSGTGEEKNFRGNRDQPLIIVVGSRTPGGRPGYGNQMWWRPQSTTRRPNESPFLALCLNSCFNADGYNPVCGSDGVTFQNQRQLQCEQTCGTGVTFAHLGPCSTSPQQITEPPTNGNRVQACMRTCSVTGEYNPVCGSNNVTYTNPGRLECAQFCGVQVKLVQQGACPAAEPSSITTTTENSALGYLLAACIRSCPSSPELKPVCGTNNVTYQNNRSLECARICGIDVKLDRPTACEAPINPTTVDVTTSTTSKPYTNGNGNHSIAGNNENNGDKTEDDSNHSSDGTNKLNNSSKELNNCNENQNRKPPSVEKVMECMQTCSLTSESNPVCGTDSITYMNPGRLLCAQFCGIDVKVKKFAPCNSSSIMNVHCLTPCTNPVTENPESSIKVCMDACPASEDYKPVCGTNNITYRNIEKLQCARRCGIDVSLARKTECSAPEDKINTNISTEECIKLCLVPGKFDPVCGSDNITYNNTGHLICARQCGLDVEVKIPKACNDTHESSTTEQTTIVTPSNNPFNITIDPDIIASIWADSTTQPASPKDDEDEDFDLDIRIKD